MSVHPSSRSLSRAVLACAALFSIAFSQLSAAEAQTSPPAAAGGSDEWAVKAREAQKRGSVFEALDDFEKALAAESQRADIRLEYAELLRAAGFWLRSAEQYKAVLQLRPDSVDCHLGYGELLMADYQFALAAEQFSTVLKLSTTPLNKEHAQVGLGTAQFAQERYEDAAKTFEDALASQPASASAIAYLALTKRKLGDLDGALRLWSRFLEIDPGAARAKIHRTEIEELKAAIDQARLAVESAPSNARAWASLGDTLRKKPDLPAAAEAYASAARLAPATSSYWFQLGLVQRDMHRWSDAASSFDAAGRDEVNGALALYNFAFCARRAGDVNAETRAWSRAVALNRRDIYAYRRLVEASKASHGFDLELSRAAEAAKKAAGADAGDPLPMVRLGLIRLSAGQPEAAGRAALEALRIDPNDVHAQSLLRDLLLLDDAAVSRVMRDLQSSTAASRERAALLIALNRQREAEAVLKDLLKGSPKDARLMVALAYCLKSARRVDDSIALLQSAEEADPGYLYVHLDLGLAYLQAGRPEEAIAAARKAVRLEPNDPVGYALLGSALKNKGDLAKAAQALAQAVAIDPLDHEGAPRLMLARVYGAMGRNELATQMLKGDLPQEPDEIYGLAWQFVRDTYIDRTFKGQDWKSWEHRFDGKLHTTAEALGAVALMLSSLDDRNTRLRSPDQTATLLFTQRTDASEFSRTGAALSTSKTVETRRLDDNVGYIAITNLDDPKLPGQIQKAVEQMQTSDGVILDLRGNQGGSDGDVPRITGMFVKPGTETGTVVKSEGVVKSKAQPPTPGGGPILPEDKPIVVLVDRNTASSAEDLAGSLKESRRAVLVGEKTYGKSGIQFPKLLPGGAIVLVVGAEHGDLKGAVYTGVGIKPDVPVNGANIGDRSASDPSVMKAREILKKRKSGS